MHTHKINPNLKEHKGFLAQNRKDPITGDTILAGDEVVFCESCKSVFLKDTWEYLGKQHCCQSETLIKIPLSKELLLSTEEDIFFYAYLFNGRGSSIPKLNEKWTTTERKLSQVQFFFDGIYIPIISWVIFVVELFLASFNENPLLFIAGVTLAFTTLLFGNIHDKIYGRRLTTIHKYFKNEVFFFSKKGIGLSSNYGIKEYTLNTDYIKSIEFKFSVNSNSYCIITNKDNFTTKFYINNLFKENNSKEFLEAIDKLNHLFSIPIHLEIGKHPRYQTAIDFVNSTESNITFEIK
ncbi:hypothetical protein [Bernardetia sp.]|uniref:hypothetical protein n=1 Tax=Bernardetia sp. TaxID=1937974 RepID=UPI0025BC69D8|nr:hypothetical protein [Bernardetia sp.]